ncbi:lipoprotein [Paenibacillus sp. GSMTC-2017]|uniref:lipoprotein n=1 Tax=Paenibacillus sp. GSMTC-2017 TaxID=2794350 RepID=UPI0018D87140|nr:lipoprotein [Paenibacillus sp. GSMTC-2017]MBH5319711.1 lipoprotein [Paenibacillus sp. GSMTC-2017]
MKKIVLIVVIGMVLLLSACSGDKMISLDHYNDLESTDLSMEKGGLSKLDITEAEVKEQKGESKVTGTNNREGTVVEYDDYQYTFVEDKLIGFTFKEGTMTGQGVKIGDPESRIAELYGNSFAQSKLEGTVVIGYRDKQLGMILEFFITDGKVSFISGLLNGTNK